ncbi:hypothetical protein O3M35_006025 [Rhynocoris fuscipes]
MKSLSRDEDVSASSKLSSYLEQLCGQVEFINAIELDHNYSKPWNWRPDSTYAKPMKALFFGKSSPSIINVTGDEIVDPVGNTSPPRPAYDEEKARKIMDDTWRQIRLLRADAGDVDWELKVERTDWTLQQRKIFERGVRILHYDRLSRLSYKGNWNEPILRRIAVDKSARRLRTLFSIFSWQYQLIRWLHFLWLDILHHEYLVAYVEILQALKKKVPSLIERLILGTSMSNKANPDILFMMLQSPWDPASLSLPCHLPRRLPGNPLFLIVPSGTVNTNTPNTRIHRWYSHLSAIGTVMLVNTNKLNTSKVTVTNSLEHLMASTRSKISELKSDYIGRNIVLVGLNSGAALACQVSLVEPVSAIVCLGFPMNTVEEKRGQPDDSLLNLNVPTLFVIGQHAATAHVNDMEDLRERLRIHTSLVVVGSADDCLRVSSGKKSSDGMTQTMVDRCVVDEVADFIGSVLSVNSSNKQDTRAVNTKPKMKIVERKRKISLSDDLPPKKSRISLNPSQSDLSFSVSSLNRPRKSMGPRTSHSGRSTKWVNESDGRVHNISRKSLEEKASVTRPSIDGIRIINKNVSFKQNTASGDSEETDMYSILPEIKVIGGEDNENFLSQLTADRLLEMPVIIAQEDSTGSVGSTISGNSTTHSSVKVTVTSGGGGLLRDDIGNAQEFTEIRQSSIRCVPTNTKTSTIQIGGTSKTIQTIGGLTTRHDNSSGSITKCATIYFREQPSTTTHAQLHKMDIIQRSNNGSSMDTSITGIKRRQVPATQLISRPRPPRIRNIPAIKHNRSDISSPVSPD